MLSEGTKIRPRFISKVNITANDLRFRQIHSNHGHRTYRAVGTRFPEATSYIPESENQGEVHQGWQGRSKMVQGRWFRIQDTKDCD
jgi:hypothetical protein